MRNSSVTANYSEERQSNFQNSENNTSPGSVGVFWFLQKWRKRKKKKGRGKFLFAFLVRWGKKKKKNDCWVKGIFFGGGGPSNLSSSGICRFYGVTDRSNHDITVTIEPFWLI